jgi:SAM-dependent methyltransferase
MTGARTAVDWSGWLERWDAQQAFYAPRREERFAVMIDLVEQVCGEAPLVLDLACGPGSIAQRVLARLPRARVVAVDVDPVLLALGRGALGDQGGRLTWVEADLRTEGWASALGEDRYDAVLTTTALHWLPPADLLRVYGDLGGLLETGGLLLNGDHLGFPPSQPAVRDAVAAVKRRLRERATGEDWEAWWASLAREPALAAQFERRALLDHGASHGPHAPLALLHEAGLAAAGFAEVGIVWSDLDDRVLLAVR